MLLINGVQPLVHTSSSLKKESSSLHSLNHHEKTSTEFKIHITYQIYTDRVYTDSFNWMGIAPPVKLPPLYDHGHSIRTILVRSHDCYYYWPPLEFTPTAPLQACLPIAGSELRVHPPQHKDLVIQMMPYHNPQKLQWKQKPTTLIRTHMGWCWSQNQGLVLFLVNSIEDFHGLHIWTGRWLPKGQSRNTSCHFTDQSAVY